jgi:glycosyltransferase involved in cell wall biosynthesis
MDNRNVLVTLSKRSLTSGVSSFWNALFKSFKKNNNLNFKALEIGGHGYNLFGPLLDQWRLHKSLNSDTSLVCLNPSLINRSFFRDGLFAKQCVRRKKPFVVFFHGWELDFEEEVTRKYQKFFQNSFGKSEKIFVLSEDFKKKVLNWGYQGEVIVETTNVDIDLIENFSIEERRKNLENLMPIKILFLARLIKEKGIFELVEAIEKLRDKGFNLELIIAGDGADFELLKERVKSVSYIRVLGDVQGKEKIALFKESHVYVLPSYTEGLPISVLEAMLFGLPVITTDVGGLKYFIKEEKMGYLVESKNVESLVERIELLIKNKEHMLEVSEYNFDYAKKNLTNNVMAKRLHKHFKEFI